MEQTAVDAPHSATRVCGAPTGVDPLSVPAATELVGQTFRATVPNRRRRRSHRLAKVGAPEPAAVTSPPRRTVFQVLVTTFLAGHFHKQQPTA